MSVVIQTRHFPPPQTRNQITFNVCLFTLKSREVGVMTIVMKFTVWKKFIENNRFVLLCQMLSIQEKF